MIISLNPAKEIIMRLPLNPVQWGAYIIQALLQQFPVLEPYVVETKELGVDEEGNGYGVVPVNNAVVPYVVREFELKPFDTLIFHQAGEPRFCYLSEPNLMFVFNNVGMGTVVERMPASIDRDVFLEMVPPFASDRQGGRRSPMHVMRSFERVKLSSQILVMDDARVKEIDEAMKAAAADFPVYATTMKHVLATAKATTDPARIVKAAAAGHLVTMEARPSGAVQVGVDNQFTELEMPKAASLLRELNQPEHVASLLRNDVVVLDTRVKEAKKADPIMATAPDASPLRRAHLTVEEHDRRKFDAVSQMGVKDPGWYEIALPGLKKETTARVFRTFHLDGLPCGYKLAVCTDGYAVDHGTHWRAAPSAVPSGDEMRHIYRRAELKPGEMAFLFNHVTNEASVPFRIAGKHHTQGGATVLQVKPLVSNETAPIITISFGNQRGVYRMGPGEIAYPKEGYSVFAVNPTKLDADSRFDTLADSREDTERHVVKVKVFKGGGLWRISEHHGAPSSPLTRGQFVQHLVHRYAMTPDKALSILNDISNYKYDTFEASVLEPSLDRKPGVLSPGAVKLAMDLMSLKVAFDNSGRADAVGMTQQGEDPGMVIDTSAAIGPEVEGLPDISDILMGFATNELPDVEVMQIAQELIGLLGEVGDKLGRILTLVRLDKVKFLTEQEVLRVFREADKFRSTLINASVSRGQFMTNVG
jgi:hypothetical protein